MYISEQCEVFVFCDARHCWFIGWLDDFKAPGHYLIDDLPEKNPINVYAI